MSTLSVPFDAVVVAAGASRRMGGIDKLTAPLLGRPLLAWTLDALAAAPGLRKLIVVAAADRLAELSEAPWLPGSGARLVAGGQRRQESVAAGLGATDGELVLVHDGARPLVTPALVDRVAAAAGEHGAAIPVVPLTETIKRVDADQVMGTVPRDGLAGAQTPQGARRELFLQALVHASVGARDHTDEASALEAAGIAVRVVDGEATNLKVTRPGDLTVAEAILASRSGGARVAQGWDSHPFGPGSGLRLCGLTIPEAPSLAGHSDGDAGLHAIADALLGGAGMGDLGRLFPSGDPATRGVDSTELLGAVVSRVVAAGWRPIWLDVTMVAARPRLGRERLAAMRDGVAALLRIPAEDVSVKAASGNLDGPEGEGRSISARALVSMVRTWPSV